MCKSAPLLASFVEHTPVGTSGAAQSSDVASLAAQSGGVTAEVTQRDGWIPLVGDGQLTCVHFCFMRGYGSALHARDDQLSYTLLTTGNRFRRALVWSIVSALFARDAQLSYLLITLITNGNRFRHSQTQMYL